MVRRRSMRLRVVAVVLAVAAWIETEILFDGHELLAVALLAVTLCALIVVVAVDARRDRALDRSSAAARPD